MDAFGIYFTYILNLLEEDNLSTKDTTAESILVEC